MTYPMQNNRWSNYFEDVQIQPDTANFNQLVAGETARYLMLHPGDGCELGSARARNPLAGSRARSDVSSTARTTIEEQDRVCASDGEPHFAVRVPERDVVRVDG